MKDIIGYKCKHCGKERGVHKAKTFECPFPGRSSFKSFSTTVYEEDKTKPITGFTL